MVFFCLLGVVGNAQHIPAKASLGVQVAPPTDGGAAALGIVKVLPNSTAEALQLEVGDLLLAINDQTIEPASVLFTTLKELSVGSPIKLRIERNGEELTVAGTMQARQLTAHRPDAELLQEEVPFREGYIRAYVNKPKGAGPFKTIYFLQGYPCQSINYPNHQLSFSRLINHWVDRGYAVFRVEKPGIGEYVDCAPCVDLNFTDELEGFSNGYRHLLQLPFVDTSHVVVYGHSLGGMVAPYLGSQFRPRGLIVFGTVLQPWEEYLIELLRVQQPLLGKDPATIEEHIPRMKAILYQLFREEKDWGTLALDTQDQFLLNQYFSVSESGLLFDRSIDFWRTLNAQNQVAWWKAVTAPVLALYGASDIQALNADDARRIAELVNYYQPGRAAFAEVPNTDHALLPIPSQAEGIRLRSTGEYGQLYTQGISPALVDTIDHWLDQLAGKPIQERQQKTSYFRNATNQIPLYLTQAGTMDVESGDLDGDGDRDLVLAMEGRANLLFFNDGKGGFTEQRTLAPKHPPKNAKLTGEDSEDVALADFDQDGHLDLFFVSEDTDHHELYWNKGDGTFQAAKFEFAKTLPANGLAVFDVNGDNYPDLLIGNKGQNELYLNQQDRTFQKVTTDYWPTNTDHTQDLKAVDLDGDGDLDLVEGVELGGTNLYYFEGNRFVENTTALPDLTTYETRKVLPSDFNGDGRVDLLLCNVGWDPSRNAANLLLLQDESGKFSDFTEPQIGLAYQTTLDAIVADLDRDGIKDLLTANGFGSTLLGIYSGTTTGFQTGGIDLPNISSTNGVALHLADFNADGIDDLYIGCYNEGDILLLSRS